MSTGLWEQTLLLLYYYYYYYYYINIANFSSGLFM